MRYAKQTLAALGLAPLTVFVLGAGCPESAGGLADTGSTAGGGGLDHGLVGTWTNDNNFWSGDYSSTRSMSMVFRPDGSFDLRSIFYAGTPDVSGNSDQQVWQGRWSTANGRLTLVYDAGGTEEFGYYWEVSAGEKLMLITGSNGAKELWTYRG